MAAFRDKSIKAIICAIGGEETIRILPYIDYEEYKEVFRKVLKEFGREDMPVLYNVNFGHSSPIGIIPYGIECELDIDNKKITLLESIVK